MIILAQEHRVLVQGITGKQGSFWAEKMQRVGTRIVGGVNPKRAGEQPSRPAGLRLGADAAMAETPFDVAVMFIPPAWRKEAALDAIDAGMRNRS